MFYHIVRTRPRPDHVDDRLGDASGADRGREDGLPEPSMYWLRDLIYDMIWPVEQATGNRLQLINPHLYLYIVFL